MFKCKSSLILTIIFVSFVNGYKPPKETTIQCDYDVDCTSVPDAFCAGNSAYNSGFCSCSRQYVLRQQENNFECLEEAKLFEDPCQIDDQCKPKFGESAACIQNKCKCSPEAHFINLKCWKSSKLGETCGNPNNCVATEHSQCNGRCSCVPGYIGNSWNTKCLKTANKLGDACEDSIQCKSVNNEASCQFNVCLCPQGYIQQGNNCIKETLTGIACEQSTLNIGCKGNQVILIIGANYGREQAHICTYQTVLNCFASGSKKKVEDRCNGKRTCSIGAHNAVFGDPCVGTVKYLSVSYNCV